jgi:hypothetical protein
MAKRYSLFVLVLGLAASLASCALAQSINITPVQTLTFPTLAIPSGSVNLTVSALNSGTSGTGQVIGGMASRGQYALSLVSGGTPVSISIDISGVSTSNPNLTLSQFSGFYKGQSIVSFPSSTLSLPATSPSATPLYIGATETATAALTPGSYSATFSITVFVQ